jgi:hypothetical protein
MEDYNTNLLNDSKNEWSIRLMNILCGHVIDGFRSIFNEAIEVCEQNDEPEKYLMTFQNFLSRIPKWNQSMVENECKRIKEVSKCDYLEDLITCVHVIQLKILSCVRTSNQNKKIDINIPDFNRYLHNVYINVARKLYSNIYLFQIDISPLEQQKHNREFEVIVQSCILNTIRDNIPIDELLRQYIDETQEVDVYTKEKVIKHDVKDLEEDEKESESKPEKGENALPSLVPPPTKEEISKTVPEANIKFEENVEKYDPINDVRTSEVINYESKPEPMSLDDYDDADEDDDNDLGMLNIGEDIKMDLGNSNVVDLGIIPVIPEKKNDVIDLGIEEISI